MANILSLAMKISADASGVVKNLTPAERALQKLSEEADKVRSAFDKFAAGSAAAAKAQRQAATDFAFLASALKTGQIDGPTYAKEYAALEEGVRSLSAAFEEGVRVQERYGDAQENSTKRVERLNELYKAGAIDIVALNNAAIEAIGIDEKAAESAARRAEAVANAQRQQVAAYDAALEKERELQRQQAALQAEADAIRTANLTAQEQFDAAISRASELRRQGVLGEQDFNRELQRQADIFATNTVAANKFTSAIEDAGTKGLKFNELSGILAALPGPLGNISGRFSGLASAGEGLSRVFSGGVSQGLSSIGTTIAGLVNPFTVGAAAVAGFGAAAVAISRGLLDLDARIQQLSNSALRLGTDFGTIQVLDEAARRGGQSLEALASGLQKFSLSIDEARSGSGKAAEAFAELGISQEQLRNTDPTTLATDVAQALQKIEDPARRAALATETLGKSGLSLLPAFNSIEEARKSIERFQTAISDIDAQRVTGVGTAFNNLKSSFSGLGQAVLAPFAGLVSGITNLFADLIGAVTRLAQAIGTVLTPVLDAIGAGFKAFGDGVAAVSGWFDRLFGSSDKTEKAVAKLRGQVEDPLDANFAKEFQKSLDDITKSVDSAINESAQFGQAGFDAALKYQESINKLKEQLDAGLFNEETFRREAEKAGVAFKDELARIEQDAQLEIRIQEDAEKTLAGISEAIGKAVNEAVKFGDAGEAAAIQFQDNLNELKRQFEAGIINETALAQGVEAANAAYKGQIDSVKQLQEEQRKLIEDDQKRIDGLLAQNDAASKLEQDLLAVQREQARVSEQLAAARAGGVQADADAAAARQAELDQLQAKLEEQQQALEQGFGQGFEAAFANVDNTINGLIEKSTEFGQAGFDAAQRLQAGIAQAQEQARAGILNQEAFERQVQQQQALFNQEIENIKEAEKQREQGIKDRAAFEKQQADEIAKAQQQQAAEQQKAQEAVYKAQEQAAKQAEDERRKFLEEQQKAYEAEVKRQEERIAALNTLGSQQVNTADLRTSQGAALVLNLAAEAQDPALIQARLQTKLLQQIASATAGAAANYFNSPVAIVGYSSFGEPA